jgi:nucleoside-diphosphate-sugar epimerase
MNLLVTGVNGFVGSALAAESIRRGLQVTGALRVPGALAAGVAACTVGAIDAETDWSDALKGVDVVIHLAARVHVMHETAEDPLAEFFKVNLHGTENLARQAVREGVKRLVYVSSIKVSGEASSLRLTELDKPNPQDPYGVSKFETERMLQRVAAETGIELVIVRPPLVYGKNVKGNFARMIKVLRSNIPLPLASVRNLRSLIYVGNLVDALIACAMHPAAAGQTFLVSDGEDISTPDLLRQLGDAMGHPARLFPCPPALLQFCAGLMGKSAQIDRLLGSLRIDSSKIRRELDWTPPYALREGFCATVE